MKNKSKKFYFGLSYFIIFLLISFLTPLIEKWFYKGPIKIKLNNDGKIIGSSPFSPKEIPPFGTDALGEPMVLNIIEGAKYTFLSVFSIALVEVLLSILIAIVICRFAKPIQNLIIQFGEVFRFFPQAILCLLFFLPLFIIGNENGFSLTKIVVIQCIFLVIINIPYTSLAFFNELQLLSKKDYVISSKLLGASFYQIAKTHFYLLARSRFLLLFLQSSTRLFWLITHLGFLSLFLGGSKTILWDDSGKTSEMSLSNEWSGLIGLDFASNMIARQWIVLVPLAFVALSIFILNLMMEEIEGAEPKQIVVKEVKQETITNSYEVRKESFTYANPISCVNNDI